MDNRDARLSTGRWLSAGIAALAVLSAVPARGQDGYVSRGQIELANPSLTRPLKLEGNGEQKAAPVWTDEGLLFAPPMERLAGVEHAGQPVWDPESRAWYATAAGCLVRLEADGTMPVVLDDVQALDVDVRAKQGLAVTREPDDTIVLYQFVGDEQQRTVLLSGPQYFNPRFSPDGKRILVRESRGEGGHFWIVTLDGQATDLGQGYGPSWHPDGEQVVFTRLTHDGHTILGSEVRLLNVLERSEQVLARTKAGDGPVAIEPLVSPDGRQLAFIGADTQVVFVAEIAAAQEGK